MTADMFEKSNPECNVYQTIADNYLVGMPCASNLLHMCRSAATQTQSFSTTWTTSRLKIETRVASRSKPWSFINKFCRY